MPEARPTGCRRRPRRRSAAASSGSAAPSFDGAMCVFYAYALRNVSLFVASHAREVDAVHRFPIIHAARHSDLCSISRTEVSKSLHRTAGHPGGAPPNSEPQGVCRAHVMLPSIRASAVARRRPGRTRAAACLLRVGRSQARGRRRSGGEGRRADRGQRLEHHGTGRELASAAVSGSRIRLRVSADIRSGASGPRGLPWCSPTAAHRTTPTVRTTSDGANWNHLLKVGKSSCTEEASAAGIRLR